MFLKPVFFALMISTILINTSALLTEPCFIDAKNISHFCTEDQKCLIEPITLIPYCNDITPTDPNASHDTWNLISRNTQLVVSGIYYWVVEADNGETQIGKLVVIM